MSDWSGSTCVCGHSSAVHGITYPGTRCECCFCSDFRPEALMFAVGRGGTEAFQRKVDEYTTAINAAVIGEWTAPVNREDSIKSRMRQLEAELAKLEARPKEPTADDPDGDVPPVVIWQKRFNVSGETYTYAAVKTDAGWFTTGQAGSFARPWDELLESIGETVDGIFLAVEHSLIADGEGNAV